MLMNMTVIYEVSGYNINNEAVEINIERVGGRYVGRFEDWPNIAILVPRRYIADKIVPALIEVLYMQDGERVRVRHVGSRLGAVSPI